MAARKRLFLEQRALPEDPPTTKAARVRPARKTKVKAKKKR